MSGATSRRKGADFERYVANKFKRLYPDARRRGGDQAGNHRMAAPDVDGTPFWIECKTGRTFKIKDAFEQALSAREAAGDWRQILVVTRAHGCPEALVWDCAVWGHPRACLLDDYLQGVGATEALSD